MRQQHWDVFVQFMFTLLLILTGLFFPGTCQSRMCFCFSLVNLNFFLLLYKNVWSIFSIIRDKMKNDSCFSSLHFTVRRLSDRLVNLGNLFCLLGFWACFCQIYGFIRYFSVKKKKSVIYGPHFFLRRERATWFDSFSSRVEVVTQSYIRFLYIPL